MTPQYVIVFRDIAQGIAAFHVWGRLGWRDARLRYRRTVMGPLWTTLSLGVFIVALGVIWSKLWNQDPKTYIPMVSSGMIAWAMLSTMANEGTGVFVAAAPLINQLRISYTMLACALVWRNLISFGHNVVIYVGVCLYAGMPASWSMPLIIPGLALLCLNGIWIAMLLGLITARFRDVQQLVATLLQVALFITPIFWAPEQLTGIVGEIEQFNLLYHYVELVRAPMLGQAPGAMTWAMVSAATVLGWGATIYLLGRFRRRIPYWL